MDTRTNNASDPQILSSGDNKKLHKDSWFQKPQNKHKAYSAATGFFLASLLPLSTIAEPKYFRIPAFRKPVSVVTLTKAACLCGAVISFCLATKAARDVALIERERKKKLALFG